MERLTYFDGGKWRLKMGDTEYSGEAVDRLAAIEDILGDEYDLDRLSAMVNQRMTMREEVAERWKLTCNIPLDRLCELVQADKSEKTKAYILDGFYCDICQKWHRRVKEIEVYLNREEAEAALRREQNG